MKKLFCILLCLLMTMTVVSCAQKAPEPVEKKYDLSTKEIADDMDIEIIDHKGKVWISAENIDTILVCFEESRGRYLEIRVDEKGEKQLKRAIRNKKRELSLVIDGEELATDLTRHEYYYDCIVYEAEYDDVMKCFNAIKK